MCWWTLTSVKGWGFARIIIERGEYLQGVGSMGVLDVWVNDHSSIVNVKTSIISK